MADQRAGDGQAFAARAEAGAGAPAITGMPASTGMPALDTILSGLRMGDNVVFRVMDVDDYRALVAPFVAQALADGRRVVYIRFGRHQPLCQAGDPVTIYDLDAHRGFESFTVRLHTILRAEGEGVFYVFDCLSDLLDAWATDTMIANFFVVTCPYLYRLDTVAYFALLRHRHSTQTVGRIREITQLLIDLLRLPGQDGQERYLHPVKVDGRWSPTMFLPHRKEGAAFVPLSSSIEATTLKARLREVEGAQATPQLDHWDRLLLHARELVAGGGPEGRGRAEQAMIDQLCRVMIANEDRMLGLARSRFDLADLLTITERLVGTGYIGGKAVGMLLARQILLQDEHRDWAELLEPHDSWYIGADVFYSFLVHNGWWPLFQAMSGGSAGTDSEQVPPEREQLRENMRHGRFPVALADQFRTMLEYFGQYPIIVRSSSLQEDGFGNAFAGKYDSVFLVGQGSPEQRYEQFLDAIRAVYASAISDEALAYRRARGLDRKEEQMALLVQRVSGAYHDRYFFPLLAGVGISYNTFVWNPKLDPGAGMLRLVLGLGTRAVDRVSGDYPRIVSLDRPMLTPHGSEPDSHRFSQHNVDVLDVQLNELTSVALRELPRALPDLPWPVLATEERVATRSGTAASRWTLGFSDLLSNTSFPAVMRDLLAVLAKAYDYPVDVEFTADLRGDGNDLRINVVQCRPLQTRGVSGQQVAGASAPKGPVLLASIGNFMGGSLAQQVNRVVLVDPAEYARAPLSGKYEVGRVVGRLNRLIRDREAMPTMLLGPGRWGTTTPSLGVPVRFAEISNFAVLGEVALAADGMLPELSFGSHFFQDLVESGIFYVALFPGRGGCQWHPELLDAYPNKLAELLPGDAGSAPVVRVIDLPASSPLLLQADIRTQRLVCAFP